MHRAPFPSSQGLSPDDGGTYPPLGRFEDRNLSTRAEAISIPLCRLIAPYPLTQPRQGPIMIRVLAGEQDRLFSILHYLLQGGYIAGEGRGGEIKRRLSRHANDPLREPSHKNQDAMKEIPHSAKSTMEVLLG